MEFNEPFQGQLQLMNSMGQALEQVDVEGQSTYQHQLDLAYLPAGVYFLSVVDKRGNRMVKKFMKL